MPRVILALLCLYLPFLALGHLSKHEFGSIHFVENKGQWEVPFEFRAAVSHGSLYLEKQAFTWNLMHPDDVRAMHDRHHQMGGAEALEPLGIRSHAFRTSFPGSNPATLTRGHSPTTDFVNYFLGSDSKRWASRVNKFQEVHYTGLYPGIDLSVYSMGPDFKYDFIVEPGADPNLIQMAYTGVDGLSLEDGLLHIQTSIMELVEQKPYAYQLLGGRKKEVKCRFVLTDQVVSFQVTGKYRKDLPLVIDPRIVFSSYSGSTSDNWGFTATYDEDGNLYGGGIVFGNGYPTTLGAFTETFQGGTSSGGGSPFDVGITKFSADGTSLLYSTYIGGNGNESPHSLIVNNNNELVVFGTTSSSNFPHSANAYDSTFNGGQATSPISLSYDQGSDLFLVKLSPNGDVLLGGTYVGGSRNDGLNQGFLGDFNYGDFFRGEVVVDANDNVYVATTTRSEDFPVSTNAFQSTYGGGYNDAVVFRMSSDLSSLDWSSYFGGSMHDAAYSVQLNSSGEVYIAGGTLSSDLPGPNNGLVPNAQGQEDGFVARISTDGQQLLARSYIGTNQYDQCYFVQIDVNDQVYVFGQTEGAYPVTPGKYVNPNSGQFIQKLDASLQQSVFSTVIGTGSGAVDLTLTAFLVTDCGQIFMAGWGGQTNASANPQSTTNGLPITPDAYQSTTDGSDFYLMVLDTNASGIVLASYFGGNGLGEHCDGGTSRFDKSGRVYQATCAGCGGSDDFPTTPGAWSNTNNSNNCNLAVVKYDVSSVVAQIGFDATSLACAPTDPILFENLSTGASEFTWFFGDGSNSDQFEPQHSYTRKDSFTVTLIAKNPNNFCDFTDTTSRVIVIDSLPTAKIARPPDICDGDTIQLDGSASIDANSFTWLPGPFVESPNAPITNAWPPGDTIVVLIATNQCGADTTWRFVAQRLDQTSVRPDTAICGPGLVPMGIEGGTATWFPSTFLTDQNDLTRPFMFIDTTTTFQVIIEDTSNCEWSHEVTVQVQELPPDLVLSPDTIICRGDSILLEEKQGYTVRWESRELLVPVEAVSLPVRPSGSAQYKATITNSCGSREAFTRVTHNRFRLQPMADTAVCPNVPFTLRSGNAEEYTWKPTSSLGLGNQEAALRTQVKDPTRYYLFGIDTMGCPDTTWVNVSIIPKPLLDLGSDVIIEFGDETQLFANADTGTLQWLFDSTLSCTLDCPDPIANPLESTTYYVKLSQTTGCFNIDSVRVLVEGALYVPNAFRPNGDGKNDVFYAYGLEIHNFQLRIYNRWGTQFFSSDDLSHGWDGTINGKEAPIGTYVWRVDYSNLKGQSFYRVGHVTLIR